MLSSMTAAWTAVTVCAVVAGLEAVCAGRNVRTFFETLRFPPYSAPLWVWSIIGAGYYAIFGFVLFRLLNGALPSTLVVGTLILIVAMMLGNALTNLVIFRARDLRLSYLIGGAFAGLDVLLAGCVVQLDVVAAAALAPYLAYRVYAIWWGRALLRLNRDALP